MGCLAGCTSNDQTVENEKNTSETEQAESGEKTVITVARWGTDSEKEAFENIFAEFEKAHPEIDVQLDFRPWDTYWDMINVNMSGGMLPDIVSVSTQLGSKYYIPGVFEDLGVLLIHIYEKGFKDFEIAYAAALGIILLIIVLLCTLAGFGLIKKLKLDYQSFD